MVYHYFPYSKTNKIHRYIGISRFQTHPNGYHVVYPDPNIVSPLYHHKFPCSISIVDEEPPLKPHMMCSIHNIYIYISAVLYYGYIMSYMSHLPRWYPISPVIDEFTMIHANIIDFPNVSTHLGSHDQPWKSGHHGSSAPQRTMKSLSFSCDLGILQQG